MSGAPRIAVVGMACRYPDAASPGELWQNVLGKRLAFRRVPPERLPGEYRGDAADLTYLTHAAVLRDWEFDRGRFGVPGALYRAADLTHWLALETAADALADAGHPGGQGLDRDRAGVILGNSLTGEFSRAATLRLRWPFLRRAAASALSAQGVAQQDAAEVIARMEELVKRPFPEPGDETLAGALSNTIAGRICNHFDLHGTGYTVDAACSSSLLAVMTASRMLMTGELSFALAGGVDLSLDPFEMVGFSRLGALARDEMRVFDARPTGFLPGEGCGVVALTRAEDAHALGLRVYAYLTGWGTSSDGAGGLTRPESSGQAMALRRAYELARADPGTTGLVEGHGTGTAVGDETELRALGTVLATSARERPAALGSVKANIGHTKAAAGVAGLIKAVLAAHHRAIPPATGTAEPHPLLAGAPVRLPAEAEPWDAEVPRAGVSSMGFGGINTHIVVEGHPRRRTPNRLTGADRRWARGTPSHAVLLLEAQDRTGLASELERLVALGSRLSGAELHDLAATLGHQARGDAPVRAAFAARTPDELAAGAGALLGALASWDGTPLLDGRAGYALASGPPARLGLLLPGQAAPVRTALPEWARDLAGTHFLPEETTSLPETAGEGTEAAQPAIVRQTLAGLAWLEALGCTPVAAVGHSLGEIPALAWAGAIAPSAAIRLATERGRIMARYGLPGTTMAGIGAPPERVTELLGDGAAVVAARNAPDQTVISGPEEDIAQVMARASAAGLPVSRLRVSHGFHSPAMLPAVAPLREVLDGIALSAPSSSVISTVTGEELGDSSDLVELLTAQLERPVLFTDALRELTGRCDLLVEAGPGSLLADLAGRGPLPAISLDCGGAPRAHAFATAVLVACAGGDPALWYADRAHRTMTLDTELRFLTGPCELDAPATPEPAWAPVSGSLPGSFAEEMAPAGTLPAVPEWRAGYIPSEDVTPEPDGEVEPFDFLRRLLADELELPIDSIHAGSSFLRDLHMNSLRVVNLVSQATRRLGLSAPATPLSPADATVGEAAELLAGLPPADSSSGDGPDLAEGVRSWVRPFAHRWIPYEDAPADADGPAPYTVTLEGDADDTRLAAVLRQLAEDSPDRLVLRHDGHPAAAAIARSYTVERGRPPRAVTVVRLADLAQALPMSWLAADGYHELRQEADGSLSRFVTVPYPGAGPTSGDAADLGVGAGTVCLVTGGAEGITAYAAADLARRTGCTLVVLGRTAADEPRVVAAMERLGVPAHYLSCDVTDAGDLTRAMADARGFGPVRGLIHGAGVNRPARMAGVTAGTLRDHLAPKVDGLALLLGAVGEDLRLLVAFGSIIGRRGLTGQAEYCLANDWMRASVEDWAAAHPACRTHLLEWSLWSGIGMGVRLDTVDTLARQGVAAIGPESGLALFRSVLDDPGAPVTLLLTGRFPEGPTLRVEGEDPPPLRFAEYVRTRTPGVEAVLDAELGIGSDPYLGDHRIGGVPVLPAVLGLEAMAQAAAVAGRGEGPWSFTDLRLNAPITVAETESTMLRVAALDAGDGVHLAVRDGADAFATDRFTARATPAIPIPPEGTWEDPEWRREPEGTHPSPERTWKDSEWRREPEPEGTHPFYGPVFFHTGRFERVRDYSLLTAFRVRARLSASSAKWFSSFHPGELILGDPGIQDAAIHALLACVPHRQALPVGAERVTVWRRPSGRCLLEASEREHHGLEYVFDVDVRDADGPVARWEGLRLRAVGPRAWPGPLPVALVGPLLSRLLSEQDVASAVELCAAPGGRGSGAGLLESLGAGPVTHDARGALVTGHGSASAAYAAGHVLVASADHPVGLDWEQTDALDTPERASLLGERDEDLAQILTEKTGEDIVASSARLWTAHEALVKAGSAEPLLVEQLGDHGLVTFSAGEFRVATIPIHCRPGDLTVAVAVPRRR
ncbi:SDR family NAD(P)-dependent oxidoreductase [Sphaerisporangium sp. NBC_01403]|uniref:type I polyketide synthase n=1 Tax=Sphaerisporangium sp. NBC_01403 TaxID=2903599 RepID=UPI00324C380C